MAIERRTILVTGSASGIGAATSRRLASAGHRVIGLDLRDADVPADLSTPAGRARAVVDIGTCCEGRLDAVIACAGLAGAPAAAMIAVNFFGTVELLAGVRPLLMGAPAPRVVAISSSAIILGHDDRIVDACLVGDEAHAQQIAETTEPRDVYASSKVALSRWVRRTAISAEWAGEGILLNAIAPGTVRTAMTEPILATAEGRAMLAQATPIAVADYAGPGDIAPLLEFLAGPECRYIVGQTIFIDGGKDAIRRGEQVP